MPAYVVELVICLSGHRSLLHLLVSKVESTLLLVRWPLLLLELLFLGSCCYIPKGTSLEWVR